MTIFQDNFSKEIWESTYKYKTDNSVDDTFYRIASYIASVEEDKEGWTDKFYEMLEDFKVTAGGRIISNAGTDYNGTTMLNCFVAPRNTYDIDSLNNIIHNLNNQALTLKSEGGWGENFSYIRPRGSYIHGIGVESPGAVKYMELFDKSSDIVTSGSGTTPKKNQGKQKIRKGAQMSCLNIGHPDIIEFITAKQTPGRLSKFNLSVNISDEFMEKVLRLEEHKNGVNVLSNEEFKEVDKWDLVFPDTTSEKYKDEWDGNIQQWKSKSYPIVVFNTVSVSWLWNLITESTYNRAEPGILFLDRANYYNPANYSETISATNPCGI
jgi:ribonucleoside-diphosphate reductase alpha chain